MHPSELQAAIDDAGLTLNAATVKQAEPLAWFEELLGGLDARTEVPEIARHRPDLSNKLHIFDSIGMVLNEDHAHHRCYEVTFALVANEVPFPPRQPFTGKLSVLGHAIVGRETESELLARGMKPTESFVHNWTFEGGTFATSLEFRRLPGRFGKRSGRHRLVSVSFGLRTPEHLAAIERERLRDI